VNISWLSLQLSGSVVVRNDQSETRDFLQMRLRHPIDSMRGARLPASTCTLTKAACCQRASQAVAESLLQD
jgi:hypothetical protein